MDPFAVSARLGAARAVLINSECHWECPNCNHTDITHEAQAHTRFHSCRGLKGLTAPMVPAGTKCKVIAHEREDYIGHNQIVTTDGDGLPIMAVETVRDDGNDVAVFAPCVTSEGRIGLPVRDYKEG